MELNRSGTATLLCVSEAPHERLPGEVELLLPGLMRGYVERFAPDTDVEAADPADWLRVLANATLLQRRAAERRALTWIWSDMSMRFPARSYRAG